MPKAHTLETLMAWVDKTDDCWLWTGLINEWGYGRVSWRSRQRQAHRVIYELMVGPLPDDIVLDHLCRVRRCVRPSHCEPVTQKENVARSQPYRPKEYAKREACRRGHLFAEHGGSRGPGGGRYCKACRRGD